MGIDVQGIGEILSGGFEFDVGRMGLDVEGLQVGSKISVFGLGRDEAVLDLGVALAEVAEGRSVAAEAAGQV